MKKICLKYSLALAPWATSLLQAGETVEANGQFDSDQAAAPEKPSPGAGRKQPALCWLSLQPRAELAAK